MNVHSDCISYEILRKEAQATMDPDDPNYEEYDKKENGNIEIGEEDVKETKMRLIINPEFVESLDMGDRSSQYDNED